MVEMVKDYHKRRCHWRNGTSAYGGSGNVTVSMSYGNDTLYGFHHGMDTINGNAGDRIYSWRGNDAHLKR